MADLVVASKVRAALKDQEVRMDGDLPDALDARVKNLLREAVKRAKENGRSTVRPHDL